MIKKASRPDKGKTALSEVPRCDEAGLPHSGVTDWLANLRHWTGQGWFRPLDLALVEFLHETCPVADAPGNDLILVGAALASVQLGRGHVCADLTVLASAPERLLGSEPESGMTGLTHAAAGDYGTASEGMVSRHHAGDPLTVLAGIRREEWEAALTSDARVSAGAGDSPLVAQGLRLYLRRFWQNEQHICQSVARRLGRVSDWSHSVADMAVFKRILDCLFPPANDVSLAMDWQKIACALVARSGFGIITGGPGTGKTTTVVRLLTALQGLQLASGGDPLRIRLAAPTGKAAARLNESIAGAIDRLPLQEVVEIIRATCSRAGDLPLDKVTITLTAAIPVRVTTLHRLLGSRPDTRHFRHHAGNPLLVDIVVVDEASMVDVEMMTSLLQAVPPEAQLILLGDKDQLASVDAGAVLGDLCQRAREGFYTAHTCRWMSALGLGDLDATLLRENGQALDQNIVMLRKSHRFSVDSGIGQLAMAVNEGDAEAVEAIWHSGGYADIAHLDLAGFTPEAIERLDHLRALDNYLLEGGAAGFAGKGIGRVVGGELLSPPTGFRHYLSVMKSKRPPAGSERAAVDAWATEVLQAYGHFQVLCATRRGLMGVEGINRRVAQRLCEARLIQRTEGWYAGRPVLVTRNDYGLGLMNGDIGITLAVPAETGAAADSDFKLRVAFPAGDGSARIRWILPSRLQAIETVYAMTVHKSQGSEFVHACLVLPEKINPVITRELIYTGITRAKHWFSLVQCGNEVLQGGIRRRVMRASGLGSLLGM